MQNANYSYLASFYAHLMHSIDYKMWAKYVFKISKQVKKKDLTVLELASGTGKIAELLKNKFSKYFVTDLSFFMLKNSSAANKNKICCSFTSLPFKAKFDFIFATFDSVNYLTSKIKFILMLKEVSNIIADDGIYTFDTSMETNSLKYLRYLNRAGKFEGIKYKQISKYSKILRVHQNKFEIILANGEKVEEIHNQKIYSLEDLFSMIDKSNFYVLGCYEAFSFNPANSKSERIQFVLKKRKNNVVI